MKNCLTSAYLTVACSSGIPSTSKALMACQQVYCKCCIGRQNIARWVGGQGHEHWRRAYHRIIVRVDCALVVELACCFVKDRMRAILFVEPCRLKFTFDQLCKERL